MKMMMTKWLQMKNSLQIKIGLLKGLLKGLLIVLLAALPALGYAKSVTVTDLQGRKVTLEVPVKKIFLADSRDILSLDIAAGGDSLATIVGWSDSLAQYAPDMRDAYFARFPALKQIPLFKNKGNASLDVEALIKLHPDVIIDNSKHYSALQESQALDKLTSAGIAVVFVDYKNNPLVSTPESIRLLSELFDQTARGDKFIQYYQQHIQQIKQRISKVSSRPTLLVERHAGLTGDSCCNFFGRLSYGELATEAGGDNLENSTDKGGDASVETILHLNPDFYLMTGANWTNFNSSSIAVQLGYNADKAAVSKQTQALIDRQGISVLRAVKAGHVMAIYHHFYDNPLNFLAIEAMAKFFHPQAFSDIDPEKDLQQTHEEFTSISGKGIFWFVP